MKLKHIDEVTPIHPYVTFKNSVLHNLIPFAILIPIAVALFYALRKENIPGWPNAVLQGIIPAFALLSIGPVFKSFSHNNWLMKADFENVFIKIRSYLNSQLPNQSCFVIELKYDEIKWVRQTSIKEITKNRKRKTTAYHKFIDICLYNSISPEILEAIKNEKMVKDSLEKKIRTKYHAYPVSSEEENMLRIRFNGITPSSSKAVNFFCEKGITAELKKYEINGTTEIFPLLNKR